MSEQAQLQVRGPMEVWLYAAGEVDQRNGKARIRTGWSGVRGAW